LVELKVLSTGLTKQRAG